MMIMKETEKAVVSCSMYQHLSAVNDVSKNKSVTHQDDSYGNTSD
jgi:hypothetical protein